MRPVVTVPTRAWAGLADDIKAAAAKRITEVMKVEARALEKSVESATASAGLGKLEKTWHSDVYPKGKDALGPAIWVWSKAPLPMRAFTQGVTIESKTGGWLAIPTPEAARYRGVSREGGVRRQRITPGGFERATGMKLQFVFTGGRVALLFATRGVQHRNPARGHRAMTAGERQRGRPEDRFLAFWLVRSATIPKRFDLKALVAASQARIKAALAAAVAQAAADVRQRSGA